MIHLLQVYFCILLFVLGGCLSQQKGAALETNVSSLSRRVEQLQAQLDQQEKTHKNYKSIVDKWEANSRQSVADRNVLVEDLRTDIKTLQGALDTLQHEYERSSKETTKILTDHDVRLIALEEKPAKPQTQETLDPKKEYEQILSLLKDKKDFDSSIQQFQEFIRKHPKHFLSSNAQYWIGEAFYAKRQFVRSIKEFQTFIDQYPKNEKECDALYKQGLAFLELKDPTKAKLFLSEVKQRCPGSTISKQANKKLKNLAPSPTKK